MPIERRIQLYGSVNIILKALNTPSAIAFESKVLVVGMNLFVLCRIRESIFQVE
jgi:hypothetical protein